MGFSEVHIALGLKLFQLLSSDIKLSTISIKIRKKYYPYQGSCDIITLLY